MVSTHAREAANLLNMQMYAQAAETLRKGLKADPKDLHCLLGLSRTLLAMGEKAGGAPPHAAQARRAGA
jgi:hypothetical protein